MVPRVAQRGQSFKGAGMYYLHDKQADTSYRVDWTYCHNLPTEDASKAMKWMAFTSLHAQDLKNEAGIKSTGRKAVAGSVYSYSLAWHPEEKPDKDHVLTTAMETLSVLGLKDHEAVFVAHNDTDHSHVHIIVNLVHPETGKITTPFKDRLKLSEWAQQYEEERGQIYCSSRVENNEKRKEPENSNKIIKNREERLERAELIGRLYEQSDSGKSFMAALETEGYSLAQGDRRGFVLVGQDGQIYSLARQLDGQRAKDIKERLADIKQTELPHAKTLSQDRMYSDPDQYEIERQKAMVDGAIQEDQKIAKKPGKQTTEDKRTPINAEIGTDGYDPEKYLRDLDAKQAWEKQMDQRRADLEKLISQFYDRLKLEENIEAIHGQIEKSKSLWGQLSGRDKALEKQLMDLRKNLENMDTRIEEKRTTLENEITKLTAEHFSKEKERADQQETYEKLLKKALEDRVNDLGKTPPAGRTYHDKDKNSRDPKPGRDLGDD